MSKLHEILRTGVAPGMNLKSGDPTLPEKAVPKAFRDLEQKHGASRIAREAGFSVKQIKRIWNMLTLLTGLLAVTATAGDLTRSITFSDGQRITAAQLHTLVDGASVNATFLTGKNLNSTVDTADYVTVYDTSAGTFTRMTLSTLLMNNTGLITTQTDEVNPAYNDYVLTYDASSASFAKVSITNLLWNTNMIGVLPSIVTPGADSRLWLRDSGTNAAIQLTNLWAAFLYRAGITNLPTLTSPTNEDRLLMWDSDDLTNKTTTLSGLFTNLTTTTTNHSTDSYLTISNGTLRLITFNNISNLVMRGYNAGYASAETALSAGTKILDEAHSLPTTPTWVRAVLICKTADLNYAVNDEVPAETVSNFDGLCAFGAGANTTNVFVTCESGGTYFLANKTTGAGGVAITNSRWRVKLYAKP